MKIVCDNCATKYSIADEKVRGKVFKIRCKKCSHIIVVKGAEGAAADSAPVGSDSGETAPPAEPTGDGWHVVLNGEQVGPLSPTEIRAKVRGGEIDGETYAWREGFGDWQKLASIDEFHDVVPAVTANADSTKRTSPDDLFGQGADSGRANVGGGGDLFGAPGGDLFAGGAPAAPAQGGGLFAQQAEPQTAPTPKRSPTPGFGSPAMSASAEPAAAPEVKAMTGARSENSVLFSLNNLQALASGGGSQKAAGGGGGGGVDNRPGFANSQTEGSGLIDIRAMAAATLSSNPSSSDSRAGEIPAFASAPVFSPIAAPILMPAAPSGPPRWVWPVIGLGVLSLVSIITVGILFLNKKPDVVAAPITPATTGVPATAVAAAPGTTPAPGTTAPAPTPAATPAVAANTPAPAAGDRHAAKTAKAGKAAAAAPKAGAKGDAPPVVAAAEPAPAPAATPKKKNRDDLDSLLDGASPSSEKPSHASHEERASDENLPDQLDKPTIVDGMHKVNPKVSACFNQFKVPGMASVAVTIGKSGRVQSASVSGAFAGTPTGDCVSKAVKSASFPPFKGAAQSINYPFMLR